MLYLSQVLIANQDIQSFSQSVVLRTQNPKYPSR